MNSKTPFSISNPINLEKLEQTKPQDLHFKEIQNLKKITSKKLDMDILFLGPRGSGKFRMIEILLIYYYGNNAFKNLLPIDIDSDNKKDGKNYQILSNKNFILVTQFVNTTVLVDFLVKTKKVETSDNYYRPIVIINLEQHRERILDILSSFIESRVGNFPILATYTSDTNISSILSSRMVIFRISSPSFEKINQLLIEKKIENKIEITDKEIEKIVRKGKKNLTQTLYYFDLYTTSGKYNKYESPLRTLIKEIVALLYHQDSNPEKLLIVKDKLYQSYLLISDSEFISTVLEFLLRLEMPKKSKSQIIKLTTEIDYNLKFSKITFYVLENYLFQIFYILH